MKTKISPCNQALVATSKITAIKNLRNAWGGLSLLDAKNIVDTLLQGKSVVLDLPQLSHEKHKQLQIGGIKVETQGSNLRVRCSQLIVAAVKAEDFTLAEELIHAYQRVYGG